LLVPAHKPVHTSVHGMPHEPILLTPSSEFASGPLEKLFSPRDPVDTLADAI